MSMMWIWPKIFRKRALSLVSQQDLQDLGHLQIAPWWWWGGNISSSSITAVPTKAQGWKLNNNNNKKKKRICKCSVSFDLSVVLNRTGVLGVFFSLRDLELEEPFSQTITSAQSSVSAGVNASSSATCSQYRSSLWSTTMLQKYRQEYHNPFKARLKFFICALVSFHSWVHVQCFRVLLTYSGSEKCFCPVKLHFLCSFIVLLRSSGGKRSIHENNLLRDW